jgi:hypothetical protein
MLATYVQVTLRYQSGETPEQQERRRDTAHCFFTELITVDKEGIFSPSKKRAEREGHNTKRARTSLTSRSEIIDEENLTALGHTDLEWDALTNDSKQLKVDKESLMAELDALREKLNTAEVIAKARKKELKESKLKVTALENALVTEKRVNEVLQLIASNQGPKK